MPSSPITECAARVAGRQAALRERLCGNGSPELRESAFQSEVFWLQSCRGAGRAFLGVAGGELPICALGTPLREWKLGKARLWAAEFSKNEAFPARVRNAQAAKGQTSYSRKENSSTANSTRASQLGRPKSSPRGFKLRLGFSNGTSRCRPRSRARWKLSSRTPKRNTARARRQARSPGPEFLTDTTEEKFLVPSGASRGARRGGRLRGKRKSCAGRATAAKTSAAKQPEPTNRSACHIQGRSK